jgi:hypothetical protein
MTPFEEFVKAGLLKAALVGLAFLALVGAALLW